MKTSEDQSVIDVNMLFTSCARALQASDKQNTAVINIKILIFQAVEWSRACITLQVLLAARGVSLPATVLLFVGVGANPQPGLGHLQ